MTPHAHRGATGRATYNRRGLLRIAMAAPLVAVAASCSSKEGRKAVPLRQPDSDSHIRWRTARAEQRLLALHEATIQKHPDLAERLDPIVAHHDAHLATVLDDGPLPIAADGLADPVADNVADDPGEALTTLRETERAMADVHADGCIAASGGTLAALLASISASETAHAAVLRT